MSTRNAFIVDTERLIVSLDSLIVFRIPVRVFQIRKIVFPIPFSVDNIRGIVFLGGFIVDRGAEIVFPDGVIVFRGSWTEDRARLTVLTGPRKG